MEIIQATRLNGHARLDSDIQITDGADWYYLASPHETRALIRLSMVVGIVKKRELRYLKATVSQRQIMAVLNPLRITPSAHVTRIRTAAGAKHWKACLDRADCGRVGTHRSLFVPRRVAA